MRGRMAAVQKGLKGRGCKQKAIKKSLSAL